ncbi:hypothetical protein [Neobacillus niacini]|uniref:hypothetical protein n=1 Tax=Neobacillus niacini TaxID=86668 RepID=UPI0021CB349A|nr:hypothetical protein [Neobacillus niacini]MCM3763676.1 hypothetical protein [Neobacillus niacini]
MTYIKVHNGGKIFVGDAAIAEVYAAAVSLASNCTAFQMDVEDEIVYEDETTCYNCRYRRWHPEGFTCYKQFPNLLLEEKSE